MGISRQDAISCKGGFSAHVRRGENRILEMERHLECLREKLNTLETMLPHSSNDHNDENGPEIDEQEGCSKMDEDKFNEDQVCVLQRLAEKEKKLRDEIFNMECKEKEYLKTLSQTHVQHSNEEMKKVEDNNDFTRVDNSLRNRQGESVEKEKISRLEEYSKKLCNCLRSIQNNRKIWSRQAGDLSKELNCLKNSGLEEASEDYQLEGFKKSGNKCPCGEPVKCNSCIICNCSDWEQDLKIDVEKELEEPIKLNTKEVNLMQKNDCRCFQTSSNSDHSSQSIEINNIYKCSMSKIHSEMSIDTPSIPSTVDGVITGNEEDKKNYCCLCKPEDDCQKFCEICLCDWEREYIRNQQLYSDGEKCHVCENCNEERFRGGTDFGISINKECYDNWKENLINIAKPSIREEKNKMREKNLNDFENISFFTYPSQVPKPNEFEELEKRFQNPENKFFLQKWFEDQDKDVKASKNKIIAALVKEISQTPISLQTEILKQSQKKESRYKTLTKDLAFGLFILLLTCLSCFLGFSGISSFFLLLKLFFHIFIFPIQTCSQMYRNFPFLSNIIQNYKILSIFHKFLIIYNTCQNLIFNYSKMIINSFQISITDEKNLKNSLILLSIFSSCALIGLFFISRVNKFLGSNGKFFNLKFHSLAKRIIFLFLRPMIVLLIIIKFVLLLSITLFMNVIYSCVPQMIRNVTYRLMNSSVNVLLVLFGRISTVSCTLNVICIILGFSLNKVLNLNQVNVHLGSLKYFLNNFLCNTSELEKTKNIPDNWIYQLLKPSNFYYIFNMIIENVIKLPKMIFRTFEIK